MSDLDARIESHPASAPEHIGGPSLSGVVPDVPLSSFSTARVHEGEINALVASRDGKSVFSGGNDGKVLITSIAQGPNGPLSTFSEELISGSKPIIALALSPDERMLAVAQQSFIAVMDLRTKLFLYKMTRIEGRITALEWDPLGQILAVGRANGDIFVWNVTEGQDAGEDTKDALEMYSAAASPVVGIVFHPSARVFFAAESSGIISIWRLLRTEEEMGLRDSWAIVDQLRTTTKRKAFARVLSRVREIWLNPDGTVFFAAAADGSVFRWKVRGLSLREPLRAGGDAVFSITGLDLSQSDGRRSLLIAAADRSQRIRFWCAENNFASVNGQISGVEVLNPTVPQTAADDETLSPTTAGGTELEMQQLEELAEEEANKLASMAAPPAETEAFGIVQKNQADEASKRRLGFVGQTEIFKIPPSVIRSGEVRPFLWASQKTGNLIVFDALLLIKSANWKEQALNCKGLSK